MLYLVHGLPGLALFAAALVGSTARADALSPDANELSTVVIAGERISGPDVSDTGTADYRLGPRDINDLPNGDQTPITDVLTQLPSVAIDQNQQIHIRSTEGPQFQYQVNGFLVPLDLNTNPPFLSMLNAMFI